MALDTQCVSSWEVHGAPAGSFLDKRGSEIAKADVGSRSQSGRSSSSRGTRQLSARDFVADDTCAALGFDRRLLISFLSERQLRRAREQGTENDGAGKGTDSTHGAISYGWGDGTTDDGRAGTGPQGVVARAVTTRA